MKLIFRTNILSHPGPAHRVHVVRESYLEKEQNEMTSSTVNQVSLLSNFNPKSSETKEFHTSENNRNLRPAEHFEDIVQSPPRAGRLYQEERARRVKRLGCIPCLNGRRIIKRTKRSLDCVRCTYLQPQYSDNNPFQPAPLPASSVGIPLPHHREKRANRVFIIFFAFFWFWRGMCVSFEVSDLVFLSLKHFRKAIFYKSILIYCEVDEFLVTRMKRQAYNPKGILDIVKVLSKTMAGTGENILLILISN
uniref:ATPase_AAA_core domain-containing protein n=1 Tax=Heterorhabditis bacteriophora TaxID=37862 RepID=A0A1I7WAF6_HETBA